MTEFRPRNPFHAHRLPLLAQLHRWGFRKGRPQTPAIIRGPARLAFYAGKYLMPWAPRGTVAVDFEQAQRTALFDARNRMFSVFYFDEYKVGIEPTVSSIIDLLVPDDGVLIDVGANWGYHSITLASRPGFHGRIHSFEPLPSTFRDLASLVDQLEIGAIVTCHNLAAGESTSTGSMRVGSNSGTAHIAKRGGGTQVQIAALDDLDLPVPTLIKVDTEGHEEPVFRGAKRLLQSHRPMLVFEHRLPILKTEDAQLGALEYLESLGYQLFLPQFSPASENNGTSTLELRAFASRNRGLHRGYTDLFACHRDEADRLQDSHGVIAVV